MTGLTHCLMEFIEVLINKYATHPGGIIMVNSPFGAIYIMIQHHCEKQFCQKSVVMNCMKSWQIWNYELISEFSKIEHVKMGTLARVCAVLNSCRILRTYELYQVYR